MNLENPFIDWRGTNKILVRAFQMRSEIGSSFCFVRFGRRLAKIVSHTPKDVQPRDIQHNRVERKIEKAEEIFGGRKF